LPWLEFEPSSLQEVLKNQAFWAINSGL
jgi:hypothetical protein